MPEATESERDITIASVGPFDLVSRLLCPSCGERLIEGQWTSAHITCGSCGATYRVHRDILDLRSQANESCWTEALAITEDALVSRLSEMRPHSGLSGLIAAYSEAHRPLSNSAQDDIDYMSNAEKREMWTVTFMTNALRRYGPPSGNERALDAGCGSGGSLIHLAAGHGVVAGVDADLPALVIAARRCEENRIRAKVLLVAAMLEQRVFAAETFDTIKCTDVIEHVQSPAAAAAEMLRTTKDSGAIFVLTPNRWNFYMREPHVKLWGIQFLPRALADRYCKSRLGIAYSTVSNLLSIRKLRTVLAVGGAANVVFVPIEDKYLNPESTRGKMLGRLFASGPLAWMSRQVRPLQPVLEAVVTRAESGG